MSTHEKTPAHNHEHGGFGDTVQDNDRHHFITAHLVDHPRSNGYSWQLWDGEHLNRDTAISVMFSREDFHLFRQGEGHARLCPDCYRQVYDHSVREQNRKRQQRLLNSLRRQEDNLIGELIDAHARGDKDEVAQTLDELVEVNEQYEQVGGDE